MKEELETFKQKFPHLKDQIVYYLEHPELLRTLIQDEK